MHRNNYKIHRVFCKPQSKIKQTTRTRIYNYMKKSRVNNKKIKLFSSKFKNYKIKITFS